MRRAAARPRGRESATHIGLFAAGGGLIENSAVDFRGDDVVFVRVNGGGGAEGEREEFGLGEGAEVDGGDCFGGEGAVGDVG